MDHSVIQKIRIDWVIQLILPVQYSHIFPAILKSSIVMEFFLQILTLSISFMIIYILLWIDAFLKGRQFSVSVWNATSTPRWVTRGIPQRSVLGPLLFLVHTADLPRTDDIEVYNNVLSNSTLLQSDLDPSDWSKDWWIQLNLEKLCCVLHIGKQSPRNPYFLSSLQLTPTDNNEGKKLNIYGFQGFSWFLTCCLL